MYVDIDEMKRHLNILFNDDDLYLAELEEAAENTVAAHLNRPSLAALADGGRLPADVRLAIKTLVANWYVNREPVSYGNPNKVPYTLEYVLQPYKLYTKEKV